MKWLNRCPRLQMLSFEVLRKHHVCKKHFESRFFSSSHSRSRLFTTAYPTLFTEEEIATGIPQCSLITPHEIGWIDHDHAYTKKRQHEDHTLFRGLAERRTYLTIKRMSTKAQPPAPRVRQPPPPPRERQAPPAPQRASAQAPPPPRERQQPPQPRERRTPPPPRERQVQPQDTW